MPKLPLGREFDRTATGGEGEVMQNLQFEMQNWQLA